MKINVLEPNIFNRIAAGEVVERPASIVKELVENSVDAGATKISVEIEEGGIKSIRVSDNGCGIEFDQLQKAFLPHATSKISSVDDLVGIKTLGFRGEALASIGSVAEVVLQSKTCDSENAGKIEIAGGIMSDVLPSSCANGTQISCNNIFFNVPARAKFLKKPKTEESEITNLIERFILANPCVSIEYKVDGKQIYLSSGKGIKDALFCIYGKNTLENTISLDRDFSDMKIYGYISKPTWTKPNKTYQTIVLNNRYIINSTIASAIHNAYGDFLMKRQYPFYCIYIDIDFEKVDVNVHPNKLDVRFENNGQIYARLFESINRALNSIESVEKYDFSDTLSTDSTSNSQDTKTSPKTPRINSIETDIKPESIQVDFETQSFNQSLKQIPEVFSNQTINHNSNINLEDVIVTEGKSKNEVRHQLLSSLSILNGEKSEVANNITFGSQLLNQLNERYKDDVQKVQQDKQPSNAFGEIPKIIGTIFSTYILVQYKDNLLIIDQHAGHERLLFDKLTNEIDCGEVTSQALLVPYIFKANALEQDFLRENINTIRQIGFDIDEFGKDSFKISEVPFILSDIILKDFIDEILSDLKVLKQTKTSEILRHKLATSACKAAVKGGDALNRTEIEKLLHDFTKNDTTLLCPHGRPVVVKFTKTEIEKMFKRIV